MTHKCRFQSNKHIQNLLTLGVFYGCRGRKQDTHSRLVYLWNVNFWSHHSEDPRARRELDILTLISKPTIYCTWYGLLDQPGEDFQETSSYMEVSCTKPTLPEKCKSYFSVMTLLEKTVRWAASRRPKVTIKWDQINSRHRWIVLGLCTCLVNPNQM